MHLSRTVLYHLTVVKLSMQFPVEDLKETIRNFGTSIFLLPPFFKYYFFSLWKILFFFFPSNKCYMFILSSSKQLKDVFFILILERMVRGRKRNFLVINHLFSFSFMNDSKVLKLGIGIKETFLSSSSSILNITQHWSWLQKMMELLTYSQPTPCTPQNFSQILPPSFPETWNSF